MTVLVICLVQQFGSNESAGWPNTGFARALVDAIQCAYKDCQSCLF